MFGQGSFGTGSVGTGGFGNMYGNYMQQSGGYSSGGTYGASDTIPTYTNPSSWNTNSSLGVGGLGSPLRSAGAATSAQWSNSWRPGDQFAQQPNQPDPEWVKTARTVRDYLAESAPDLTADRNFVLKFDPKEEKLLITFVVKARGSCNEWWGKTMDTCRKHAKAEYTDLVVIYWSTFRLQLELRTTHSKSSDKKDKLPPVPTIQVTIDVDGFNDAKKELTLSISCGNTHAADASNLAAALFNQLRPKQDDEEENDEAVKTRLAINALQELGVAVYDYRSSNNKPADLAGYEEVKHQVFQSIALPLRHKGQLLSLLQKTRGQSNAHGALVKGVLFVGPPGVGKTSLAKLVTSRIRSILVYVPVESIMSKWYGVAEQRLAEVFRQTARLPEAIMFLDELDGFVPRRDAHIHEATRRMLSVLLRHLDGLDTRGNIITIGASNRPSDLDAALVSRFDEKVVFNEPNEFERSGIFSMYAKTLSDEECTVLAQHSDGMTGRDIRSCCTASERSWAFDYLTRNPETDCIPPPPAAVYLAVLKKRQANASEFQEVGQ